MKKNSLVKNLIFLFPFLLVLSIVISLFYHFKFGKGKKFLDRKVIRSGSKNTISANQNTKKERSPHFFQVIVSENDLRKITQYIHEKIGERNIENQNSLAETKNYIKSLFKHLSGTRNGYDIYEQKIDWYGEDYVSNLIIEKKGVVYPEQAVIIACYYDTKVGENKIADAQTIAFLCLLAHSFADENFKRTLRFVFFANQNYQNIAKNYPSQSGTAQYSKFLITNRDRTDAFFLFKNLNGQKIKKFYDLAKSEKKLPPPPFTSQKYKEINTSDIKKEFPNFLQKEKLAITITENGYKIFLFENEKGTNSKEKLFKQYKVIINKLRNLINL